MVVKVAKAKATTHPFLVLAKDTKIGTTPGSNRMFSAVAKVAARKVAKSKVAKAKAKPPPHQLIITTTNTLTQKGERFTNAQRATALGVV